MLFRSKIITKLIDTVDIKVSNKITSLVAAITSLTSTNADIVNLIFNSIKQANFSGGVFGSGVGLNGDVWEVDNLLVRKTMTVIELIIQKARYQGGQLVLSSAGCKITNVETQTGYWKLSFEGDNEFVVGDFAKIQNFNGTNIGYLWAEVIAVGTDYLHLSRTSKDPASNYSPKEGDDLIHFGNKNDRSRQSIMLLSTVNNQVGLFLYDNVNSFSLEGKGG